MEGNALKDYIRNIRFLKKLWKSVLHGQHPLFWNGAYILCMAVNAAMVVLLPSVALSVFEHGRSLLYLVGAALFTGLSLGAKDYLQLRSYYPSMVFRVQSALELGRRMMRGDVERMQGPAGMELQGAIHEATFKGNQIGIEAFWTNTRDLVVACLSAVIYVVMSASLDWRLLPLILLPSVVKAILDVRMLAFEEESFEKREALGIALHYLRVECLRDEAGKDMRLYPLSTLLRSKMEGICDALQRLRGAVTSKKRLHETIFLVLRVICLMLCGWFVVHNHYETIEASTLVLFVGSIWGISSYIDNGIATLYEIRLNSRLSTDLREKVEREEAYVKDESESDVNKISSGDIVFNSTTNRNAQRVKDITPGDIVFEGVSYRYHGSESDAISALDLVIKKGQKLALVGENGAGKTTLAMLAAGILKPTEGRVLWDGVDLASIPRRARNRQTLFVFQDVFVFAGTIAENICGCERADIDEARLWEALEQAGMAGTVRKFPDGIDTNLTNYIEKDGIRLSGGQMQRLMLARALYKDGSVLILDEPTSALDPLAEADLYRRYYQLVKDDTSIFISHRLSSTQFCDRVIFLKDGKLAEDGTHHTLLAQDSLYREMFEAQAQYYRDHPTEEPSAADHVSDALPVGDFSAENPPAEVRVSDTLFVGAPPADEPPVEDYIPEVLSDSVRPAEESPAENHVSEGEES